MPENKKIEIKFEDSDSRAQNQEATVEQAGLEKTSDTLPDDDRTEEQSYEEKMEARIQELENEAEVNYDRFVRVTADFENYKKRMAREMSDLRKFANENILKDMLSVVDNLERAIESGSSPDSEKKTIIEGVEITLKDLFRMLEKYGVKDFESRGKPFDPVYHQAMMQEQTSDYPDNTVLNELQKGYTIHDRLLRPAMVVVARNVSDSQCEETDESK